MKTVYVIAKEQFIIDAFSKEIKKYTKDLELVGSGSFDESSKQNCSFQQPDFILTGDMASDEALELLELCKQSTIIIASGDMLRANNTINAIQEKGIYRITAVDRENTSPTMLCDELVNLDTSTIPKDEGSSDMNFNEDAMLSEDDLLSDTASKEEIKQNVEVKSEENEDENIDDDTKTIQKMEASYGKEPDMNDDIDVRPSARKTSFNLNINNIRSKTITIFSKKGGTGCTTIAKEMCNVFSSIKLPKKLQNGNEYLKVCMVDFDFERGNLRTFLGMENPSPNIYYWINDILDRIEAKANIDTLYYNQFQVMGYLQKVQTSGNFYTLITGQGGLPPRILSRLAMLDTSGDLLIKILNVILQSLRRTFDVVMCDTPSTFDTITKLLFENSDNILYVVNPTVVDIENLKVFTDELKICETVDPNKIGVIINKFSKHLNITNDLLDVLSLVKYEDVDYNTSTKIDKNYPLISDIPNDETIINFNNSYVFLTNNGSSELKKGILKACEFVLPVFKVKPTSQGLADLKKKQARKQAEALKKAKLESKQKTKAAKTKKEQTIEKLKTPQSVSEEKTEVKENTQEVSTSSFGSIQEYFSSDLSNETYDNFIRNVKAFPEIKTYETGFPKIRVKPGNLNKKTWKTYQKNLTIEAKKNLKAKRTKSK